MGYQPNIAVKEITQVIYSLSNHVGESNRIDVVLVYPIDKWIHVLLAEGVEIRNLKDIHWLAIEDRQPGKGTGRWVAALILDPEKGLK